MKTVKIVWNGCDNYVESECAESRGYNFADGKLYHGAHEFSEFEAVEVFPSDGSDLDGVSGTETGRYYVGIDTECAQTA